MRRIFALFLVYFLAVAFVAVESASTCSFANQNIEDMIQDKVEVWVELNVSYMKEERFKAGDPPATVRSTFEISFRKAGVWTFVLMKEKFGGRYQAFPGILPKTEWPSVSNVAVSASHPCQDGEGSLIGQETVHPPTEVNPALGEIKLIALPGGKMRINLMPSHIDVEYVECPNPKCNAGFPEGWITIGENPATTVEDEHGSEIPGGYELGVFDWNSLKAVAKGGELELTLPLAADDVQREDYEDPPGYPASTVETYSVKGWIGPVKK